MGGDEQCMDDAGGVSSSGLGCCWRGVQNSRHATTRWKSPTYRHLVGVLALVLVSLLVLVLLVVIRV
jgi:hypothetical protein